MEARTDFDRLLADVRACSYCSGALVHGVRPVLQIDPAARILIAGQAPGRRVHESGIPFDDRSGDRLRDWLDVSPECFYDPGRFAILPMGFCYPGTGTSGDLPPRPECARRWRETLLAQLRAIELTVVIGRYALEYHLPSRGSLTERVRNWRETWPRTVPLPHPSPRNNRWLARNPWFESELVPALRRRVGEIV